MDLTTLDNVKGWLGVAGTADDDVLSRLIGVSSAAIAAYLGREVLSQGYDDVRDGTGGRRMAFRQYPVTAVGSVVVDGTAIPLSTGVLEPGYAFDSRFLWLRGARFTPGFGNVALSYTAGYQTTPADIEQACLDLVALRYAEKDRVGVVERGVGGESVKYLLRAMPMSVQQVLDSHRKVVML